MTPKQIRSLVITIVSVAGAVVAGVFVEGPLRNTIVAALIGLAVGGQTVPRIGGEK